MDTYLDLANSLLSGHLKGVSVLGTQKELHLDATGKKARSSSVIVSMEIDLRSCRFIPQLRSSQLNSSYLDKINHTEIQ